jgi:hypothetical protein
VAEAHLAILWDIPPTLPTSCRSLFGSSVHHRTHSLCPGSSFIPPMIQSP